MCGPTDFVNLDKLIDDEKNPDHILLFPALRGSGRAAGAEICEISPRIRMAARGADRAGNRLVPCAG